MEKANDDPIPARANIPIIPNSTAPSPPGVMGTAVSKEAAKVTKTISQKFMGFPKDKTTKYMLIISKSHIKEV